jgi:uncharacterized protein
MSQENVDAVRRAVDAWNRQDLQELLALCDPEHEFVNSPTAVEPGTRRGIDALAAVLREQWEGLRDGRLEIDQFYDRGEEVIALGHLSRPMPASNVRISDRFAGLWKLRDGKLARMEVRLGVAEVRAALEAAGLSEQDAHADS